VDKKYKTYSVEDFTQDLHFINWVNKGINSGEWEDFLRENPDLAKDVNTARKIVTALRYRTTDIHENEVSSVYRNIENFHQLHQGSRNRVFSFKKLFRYAAAVLLVVAFGSAVSYIYLNRDQVSFAELPVVDSSSNQAKLILSGGKEILLKEKQTDLKFNAAGTQIKIDRDSIVDYNQAKDPNAMAQVVIPFGRRSDILLSDGTKVWLNAGSKLIFPQKFSGKSRKVFLKGEAYFDVFKNKDIPFIVSTDQMNVTVHGTEFNLKDNDSEDELEVVLVEGSVSMKENSVMSFLNKEIVLKPNQRAVYNKIDKKTNVESNVAVAYYVSWKDGLLEFNREPIATLFNRLSRFYNVRFVTEEGVLLNRIVSGKLDLKDSLDDVLKVVSDVAPLKFRVEEDRVIVSTKINSLPMR